MRNVKAKREPRLQVVSQGPARKASTLKPDPEDVPEGQDWKVNLNPKSLEVVMAKVEPSVKGVGQGYRCQFERHGYFCIDRDSKAERLVFNRSVSLRDTWAKVEQKERK